MTAHAHSHHTTWLLRRTSTSGPAGSYPPSPKPQGSLQNPSDPWHVPALAALTPCIFTPEGQRWSAFLQRTRLGRRLVRLVFGDADKRYARDCLRLPSTPSTRTPSANPSSGITTGLSALKPSRNAFWGASSAGPASNPAIWPTLQSGAVQIIRADLQRVVPEGLLLEDGTMLEAETIVCGTGWVPGVERVFGEELAQELGLRGAKGGEGGEWEEEDGRAREYVLGRFPILAEADPVGTGAVAEKQTAPYRLYRGIVPLADPSHSIVFLGLVKIINSFRTSEVQALWASAYLDGSFHHPPSLPKTSKPSSPSPSAAPFWPDLAARRTDVARCVQWSYLRYPDSRGKAGGLGMALDGLAYTGVLLRDLGLGSLEDGKSWWGSWIGLVWAGDLRGLVAEYRAKSQGACKACGISWGL